MRNAHYVISTHWDREWYEPLQGYRMRLVSLLDEVLDTLERDPAFKAFTMDGQFIPVADYLEIRPEELEKLRRFAREGRFVAGPWYVLPDEWLVSGESIIRNIQLGMRLATELGGTTSRAGFACDLFGHIGQLPQIFTQLGIPFAYIWRGTYEKEHKGHLLWKSPDGTEIPSYRFGRVGYCTWATDVRACNKNDENFDPESAVQKVVDFVLAEASRSSLGPILLFDGGDHIEIEPAITNVIAKANEKLAAKDIRILHSTFDAYQAEALKEVKKIDKRLEGELRETGREPGAKDEQWLIPGVYSSRIHLKQRNAACEDELCLWAEPLCAFTSFLKARGSPMGSHHENDYPLRYLRVAWKHLLDNHPHDSICGCSPDQVHQDMIYRFDQSLGISSRLTQKSLRNLLSATDGSPRVEGSLKLALFNPTSESIDMPVDLDVRLPSDWKNKFQEFFGFEEKFAFKLVDHAGTEIPYQLVSQQRDRVSFRRNRRKFPVGDVRHVIRVTAPISVPAFGYTTLFVEPAEPPTRYLGTMATSHRSVENEHLSIVVNSNGTLDVTCKKTGKTFSQLLTFEQRADIGDGWYHGVAVNDSIITSAASSADVAIVADGLFKSTLRITVTMTVPQSFDFKSMTRSTQTVPLRIVSEITLRKGGHNIEVTTTVENNVLDHRLRVLFPTALKGDSYFSDSAFDVVERKIALAADNAIRKELDVETKPQSSWSAFTDGTNGLAVIARGIPEIALCDTLDRPLALTLIRAFRRAVLSNDNMGGQIQGTHVFRYDLRPFTGELPTRQLFLSAQRLHGPIRQADLLPIEMSQLPSGVETIPAKQSFLTLEGDAIVTSIQREAETLLVRLFNPHEKSIHCKIARPLKINRFRAVTLEGEDDPIADAKLSSGVIDLMLPARRIVTLLIGQG